MPTTLDCTIMRNVFGTARMRAIFDSSRLLQGWLDVWAALAEAEAEVGLIPPDAAVAIGKAAKAENFDLEKISAGIEAGRHILMPAIRALAEASGEAGKFVHWGTTTTDVIDTGLVLQLREAIETVAREVSDITAILVALAQRYKGQPMAGRTHWQHAVPITFGLKVAQWVDQLQRDTGRLEHARQTAIVSQIGGAAGTFASLGSYAKDVQAIASRRLGLPLPSAPWYVVRDRFGELVSALGMLAATIERINIEIGSLSGTEIGELAEPLTNVQVGSSTMPQKRNPINSERAAAGCKIVRGLVPVMQGLMVLAHERDMSANTAEWLLLPQCLITLDGSLLLTHRVLDGLVVDTEKMNANLALTRGGIVAEAVMFGLARHMGREHAHEVTIAVAREARERNTSLLNVLHEHEEVRAILDEEQLRALVDPINHLGLAEDIVDQVTARAQAPAIAPAE